MLSALPEDVVGHIAGYLQAPEVMKLLCADRGCSRLGTSSAFWEALLLPHDDGKVEDGGGGGGGDDTDEEKGAYSRDEDSSSSPHSRRGTTKFDEDVDIDDDGEREKCVSVIRPKKRQGSTTPTADADEEVEVATSKMRYLIQALTSSTPLSVRWRPVACSFQSNLGSRQGHVMCALGDRRLGRRVILYGGHRFDDSVRVLDLPRAPSKGGSGQPQGATRGRWLRCPATSPAVPLLYNATLTALDSHRAVLFGRRSKILLGTTNDVYVLTMTDRELGYDITKPVARWRRVQVKGDLPAPRVGHTATLINGRYLLILGGAPGIGGLIPAPALLDCKTWKWLPFPITTGDGPSHDLVYFSVVLDGRRDRLVLFGRRGFTFKGQEFAAEVYALEMGDVGSWRENLFGSLPWTWRRVRKDDIRSEECRGFDCLLPGGFKVSPDLVLFMPGVDDPSTKAVLTFDLREDAFRRPIEDGPHPSLHHPTGIHLDGEGWIVVHGADKRGRSKTVLLDLAPALLRPPPL